MVRDLIGENDQSRQRRRDQVLGTKLSSIREFGDVLASVPRRVLGEAIAWQALGPAVPAVVISLTLGWSIVRSLGSTVTVGSVTCEVPPENVARGIACAKGGHGFEASRVASRQKVY